MKRKGEEDAERHLKHKKAKDHHSTSTNPTSLADVPAYVPFSVSKRLPPLPMITQTRLQNAPFKHKSTIAYSRTTTSVPDVTYERLEFLGDAYIELIASRLIYERFGYLPAGRLSQLRELVVKNETLAEYSRAYGFDKRLEADGMHHMREDAKLKGNKGLNKVLGDVFEAYVAAVILSDAEHGFAIAEKWLTALWAAKLEDAVKHEQPHGSPGAQLTDADVRKTYNPTAKAELQRRIMGPSTKLQYEAYKAPLELKGDLLGQNKHFIAIYLTGWGYERQLLGKGEGKNKVEAGNWAATEAMHGESKRLVEECEEKLTALRRERDEKKARQLAEDEKGRQAVEGQ